MVASTKERSLEAAVALLGEEGIRALTHARVDARAGLPAGSTSNWFRTRRALLAGVVDHIAERERADADPSALPVLTTAAQLADVLAGMLEVQSGPLAARTRARHALFLEVGADDELGEPLRRQRAAFTAWTERIVTDVGIADPEPAARALMALCDGLLLHRLTVDPTLAIRPVIERAVHDLAQSRGVAEAPGP